MSMPNGAGAARRTASLVNQNSGGGEKKSGIFSSVARPGSTYIAERYRGGQCTVEAMKVHPLFNMVNQARPIGMMPVPRQNIRMS